jgi:acetylornithine deacetylase/succinyl-diaminopimelate desuccinylase-like protein
VDTDLFRAIQRAIQRHYPGAPVIPAVSTGFTDSHFTRDLGIVSYGFNPAIEPAGDGVRTHGNDERVLVEQVKLGTRIMLELVADVTGVRR